MLHSAPTAVTLTAPPPNFPPPPVTQSPFPAPGAPAWFAPPTAVTPQPVTLAQIWRATTPGVVVPLVVGALFPTLSITMLVLSFALSSRVHYRQKAVRAVFGGAFGVLGLVAAISLFDDSLAMESWWDLVSIWGLIACWILPVVVGLVVGSGIRAGERPERPL
ncbi:MAG: hypothetical protein WAS07_02725, partial [Micropruina sp.]